MAFFEYTGRSSSGESIRGRIEAVSTSSVAAELTAKGIIPVRIQESGAAGGDVASGLSRWWNRRSIDLVDVIMFCRQMVTLSRAGVPITRGLRGLADSMRNPEFGRILGEVADELEKGRELASVLQNYPDVFSNLFISVVHIGESSGRLEESFEQLHGYLELEDETRKRIKSAFRYPTMVLIAMIVSVAVIDIYVVPPFANLFSSFGSDLPWATRLLITTSELTTAYWHIALSMLLCAAWLARKWHATPEGHKQWDRLVLRVPKIGGILERALMARFCRTLSITLGAGLPVTQCLSIAARAVDNEFVGEQIQEIRRDIEGGDALTAAAYSSGLFTPLVLQMLSVGEETGAVEDTLSEVAGYYEREVDYDLKTLGDLIEPVMMIFVGGLVLALALGVYLPMWEMASAAKG